MSLLDRPLALPLRDPRRSKSFLLKTALVLCGVLVMGFLVSRLELGRSIRRLDVSIASGSKLGNYHAVIGDLSAFAGVRGGRIRNVETSGSGENIARLLKASGGTCDLAFALVQDGSDWGDSGKLRLIGRLYKAESLFFLGKDADKLAEFSQLAGARIGIGPAESGTAQVAKQFFSLPELGQLGIKLSHHESAEQLELAKRGDLELAAFIIDEDASFIVDAIRNQGLQIAGFAHLDVMSRRMPRLRTGRIGAGQYEAVKVLPPQDKRVLRVDSLLVANRCPSRSTIIDLMTVVRERFPEFVRHNRETPNASGLELADAAKGFLEHDGPELADEYAPWLVDLMPPANWAYVVMGVSLLFNAMGIGHRFRLWRIDDARVKLENELTTVFGPSVTLGEIARADRGALADPKVEESIAALVKRLEALAARSRRQSLSMLVPMGQEMGYRYQEEIIYQTLAALRGFLERGRS